MLRKQVNRRAFAMYEVLAMLAVCVIIMALLAVFLSDARRRAAQTADLDRLHWLGASTFAYTSDNFDRLWTFSWRAGQSSSGHSELNGAETDIQAAANEAVDIIRRNSPVSGIQPARGWLPHLNYSHVVLADHLGMDLPDERFVSVRDRARIAWSRNPVDWRSTDTELPNDQGMRWPFSSSFEMPVAMFSFTTSGTQAIRQGTRHDQWIVPNRATPGRQSVSAVRFPEDKALVFDTYARHTGPGQLFYAYEDAQVPVLTVAGHAFLSATREANPGWDPLSTVYGSTFFRYAPSRWEPGTISGASSDAVRGYYRYTSMGVLGRDFGGPEVRTAP